jgi:hypothetical protein
LDFLYTNRWISLPSYRQTSLILHWWSWPMYVRTSKASYFFSGTRYFIGPNWHFIIQLRTHALQMRYPNSSITSSYVLSNLLSISRLDRWFQARSNAFSFCRGRRRTTNFATTFLEGRNVWMPRERSSTRYSCLLMRASPHPHHHRLATHHCPHYHSSAELAHTWALGHHLLLFQTGFVGTSLAICLDFLDFASPYPLI